MPCEEWNDSRPEQSSISFGPIYGFHLSPRNFDKNLLTEASISLYTEGRLSHRHLSPGSNDYENLDPILEKYRAAEKWPITPPFARFARAKRTLGKKTKKEEEESSKKKSGEEEESSKSSKADKESSSKKSKEEDQASKHENCKKLGIEKEPEDCDREKIQLAIQKEFELRERQLEEQWLKAVKQKEAEKVELAKRIRQEKTENKKLESQVAETQKKEQRLEDTNNWLDRYHGRSTSGGRGREGR